MATPDPDRLPLPAEVGYRLGAAGFTPDDPGLARIRAWNAAAIQRAGTAACECGGVHLALNHELKRDGSRGRCTVYAPSGPCPCTQFREAA